MRALGYDEKQITDIIAYAVGRATLAHSPWRQSRRAQGQGPAAGAAIDKIEAALGAAFDIRFVLNKWTLGVETL